VPESDWMRLVIILVALVLVAALLYKIIEVAGSYDPNQRNCAARDDRIFNAVKETRSDIQDNSASSREIRH
jgi:hypothetical protein